MSAADRTEAGQLAEVRRILAAFDWETGDRQHALEQLEQIDLAINGDTAGGGEDQGADLVPYCSACGQPAGIFLGHGDAWRHYTGQGTVESPVELHDAGHKPVIAWREAGAR